MTLPVAALLVMSIGMQATQLVAPARPDFSGRWMIVGAPTGSPASLPGVGGLGSAFEARQDEKTLTLVTGNDPDHRETALPLNGDELRIQMVGRGFTATMGGPELEYIAKLTWDGARLVVTTTAAGLDPRLTTGPGRGLFTTQSWSLDANGDLLIETTRSLPTVSLRTSKATYRRFR